VREHDDRDDHEKEHDEQSSDDDAFALGGCHTFLIDTARAGDKRLAAQEPDR